MNFYDRNESQGTSQEGKAKIMLLFPPVWAPHQPYSSLPALTAFLRGRGYKVIQKDVNIEAYNKLLTKERLKESLHVVSKQMSKLEKKDKLSSQEQSQYTVLSRVLFGGSYVIENIEKAIKTLKSEKDFYNFKKFSQSRNVILRGLNLLSAEHYPTILNLVDYSMRYKYSPYSTNDIMKAIDDEKTNLFIRFYREHVIPAMVQANPDVVGISIVGHYQIIAGLTLAKLAKHALPEAHIVVGGPVFSLLINELRKNRQIFSIVDSFVVNEGETALVKLAEAVKNKVNFRDIPNLIYYDQGKVVVNKQVFIRDMNSIPTYCYDGLPLKLYWLPKLILSIQPARGCYWNKCQFCNTHKPFGGYKARDAKLLIEDIRLLSKKYRTKYFALVNESIEPKLLREIASLIIENDLDVRWYGGMRFEEEMTFQYLKLVKDAGCQKIYFGLESGCQRVLDLMEKGTKRKIIQNILNYCYDNKIAIHLYCLIGFPTETAEEAKETVKFVIENGKILNYFGFSYTLSAFQLKKLTKVCRRPSRYELEIVPEKYNDLWFMHNYKVKLGMSMEEVQKMLCSIDGELSRAFNKSPKLPLDILFLYLSHPDIGFKHEFALKDKTRDLRWIMDRGGKTIVYMPKTITKKSMSYDLEQIKQSILNGKKEYVQRKKTRLFYDILQDIIINDEQLVFFLEEINDGASVARILAKFRNRYGKSNVGIVKLFQLFKEGFISTKK